MSELDDVGPGTLKLIVANDDEKLEFVLGEWFPEADSRRLAPGVWIVFGVYDLATLRDSIGERMPDEFVFMVEFERWSGHGEFDAAWLLRRGH